MSDSPPTGWKKDDASTGRHALLRLLRIVLIAVIILVTFFYVLDIGQSDPGQLRELEINLVTGWPWVLLFALTLAFGVIAIDVLTPEKKIVTVSGVFFGIVAGVVASIAFSFLIDRLAEAYEIEGERIISTVKILLGIGATYLCVSIVLQTQDQFRLVIPYVEFSKQIRGPKPMLLDTSVLIDGRIIDIARIGALQTPLVIPQFVLAELQQLADSRDKTKRSRGRRGLDVVSRLQREPRLDITIDDSVPPAKNVDQMLVDLALTMPGIVVTTDSALERVAGIHGAPVLNLNELAQAMRPNVLPGEILTVTLLREGEHAPQAVGYLDDGTMVVAEDGAAQIGQRVQLTVMSTLQTSAGRMIFARLNGRSASSSADDAVTPDEQAATDEHIETPTDADASTLPDAETRPPRRDPRKAKARNPRR